MDFFMNEEDLRSVKKGSRFVSLFSGGKDSGLALSIGCKYGTPAAVIHSAEISGKSYNHDQDLKVVQLQAQAMRIPLRILQEEPKSQIFMYKLIRLLKEYVAQGVEYLVTGTIFDRDAYYFHYYLCKTARIKLACPLWGFTDNDILTQFEKNRIKTVISSINPQYLSTEWLGKLYDRNAYNTFLQLGINPFGENGEFHTTLIDADCFKKEIRYQSRLKTPFQLEMELSIK